MGDDLVTEEIEIDPVVARAGFRAAQNAGVERARGCEVVNRKARWKRGRDVIGVSEVVRVQREAHA